MLENLLRHISRNFYFSQFLGVLWSGAFEIYAKENDASSNPYHIKGSTAPDRNFKVLAEIHCTPRNAFITLKYSNMEGFQL